MAYPEKIPIHMVWVGNPVSALSGREFQPGIFNILTQGVRMLKTEDYSQLLSDVGGFLSLLEEIYCTPAEQRENDKIELYFHCYGEFVEDYQKFFEKFCANCSIRYPTSRPPIFHVKSIEETLEFWKGIDYVSFVLLSAYYNFIRDYRVKNIRNKVNFRDVFNFCVLYRFGGYTFDTNVCILPFISSLPKELQNEIIKIREQNSIPLNISFTSIITKIPLMHYVEPITLYKYPGRTIYLSLNKTEFIMHDTNDIMTNCNIYQFSDCHDIYALRSQPEIADLKETVKCLIVNFIQAAQMFANWVHWNASNYDSDRGRSIYSQYFTASMVSAILGSVYTHVKNAISAPSPTPNTVEILMLPKRPLNIENFVTYNALRRAVFITLPLIKHFQNTHHIKPEYFENRSCCEYEYAAIKAHIALNIKPIATLKFSTNYYFP